MFVPQRSPRFSFGVPSLRLVRAPMCTYCCMLLLSRDSSVLLIPPHLYWFSLPSLSPLRCESSFLPLFLFPRFSFAPLQRAVAVYEYIRMIFRIYRIYFLYILFLSILPLFFYLLLSVSMFLWFFRINFLIFEKRFLFQ